jgi:hypothetical protein
MHTLKEDLKTAMQWRTLKGKIREACWAFRYAFRRAVKGYDDREVFNFDRELLDRMYKLLGKFKKHNVGLFVSQNSSHETLSEEETNNVIDSIRDQLKYFINEDYEIYDINKYFEIKENQGEDAAKGYRDYCMDVYTDKKHDLFVLLEQYFDQLWY